MIYLIFTLFLTSQLPQPQFRRGEIVALASDPSRKAVVFDITWYERDRTFIYTVLPAETIFSRATTGPVVEDTQSSLDQARQMLVEGRE